MDETFLKLREVMLASAPDMIVIRDEPGDFSINAPWNNPTKPKQPMWFGGVKIGKTYVSYYLMPVYSEVTLAQAVPDVLRKRQQGKSCFNFRTIDDLQAQALAQLTAMSAQAFAIPIKV